MCCHSLASDRATTATTGSVSLALNTSCGDAGLDEDEVTGRILHDLLQPVTIFVADAPLQDVEHHLESDVDVGGGDAAGRDVATFIESCVAATFFADNPT